MTTWYVFALPPTSPFHTHFTPVKTLCSAYKEGPLKGQGRAMLPLFLQVYILCILFMNKQ